MSSDDEWTPQFEHIDWNDIVEAEQSGDAETLQGLRDKSMELKRSFSCPSPSTAMTCSPVQPSFKVPQTQPPTSKTRTQTKRPFMEWDDLERDEYPALPRRNTHPSCNSLTSPSTVSYAQVLQPRLSKRTISERHCLSPIDCQPKRSALTNMMSTPNDDNEETVWVIDNNMSTPQGMTTTTTVDEEQMEYATPDTDSRPSKAVSAVQRRLFPFSKENSSPKSTADSKSLSDKQLTQREKQITYGKNTLGYQRYSQTLPKWQRKRGDPMTPDKFKACSTRAWQGQIKVWRRALHQYDPPNEQGVTQFTKEQAELCDLDIPGHQWVTPC